MSDESTRLQRFVPGGKPGPGRPRGSVRRDSIATFCRELLNSAEYQQKLMEDLYARRLPVQLEVHMWDRAYGPIPREIKVEDVSTLPTTDLLDRMRQILSATPTADVLPADVPGTDEPGTEPYGGEG